MNYSAYRWQNNLFAQSYRDLSWSELLEYYRNKPSNNFFPLSAGKNKHLEVADEVLVNRFNLNNECYQLPEQFDWLKNPSADLEWQILLHKFYYLKELACAYDYTRDEIYARKWVELIDSWIDQVPIDFIDTQVIGRRLQQWLISYRYFVGKWQSPSVMPDFFARFLESVNSQTVYLCEHLTPEGNHRTLELYAIFMVAVTFPELALAEYFLEFSKKHLLENIRKDLLTDGVHRELSTDYHHTVLKNYLRFRELAGINQIALPDQCDQLLLKALKFSYFVHKPDGFIPAINDGDCNSYLPLLKKAFAIYADPHIEYALTQGEQGIAPLQRAIVFPDSGYCILRSDWQRLPYQDAHYLFFDCAQLGFGSHGHYDALNFEAAAYGHSLIVDPGRYTYCETGHEDHVNWRKYFKGTAAHNTVMINSLDQIAYQCERPIDPEPDVQLDFFISHEGFDWVQGKVMSHRYPVIHERSIFFLHAEYWIVTDRLMAKSQHDYDLRFHLSPLAQDQVELKSNSDAFVISSPNLVVAQPKQAEVNLSIESGFVSPEYGIKQPAPIISFSKKKSDATLFNTLIYPYKEMPPVVNVRHLPVLTNGNVNEALNATALKIEINSSLSVYEDIFFINHNDNTLSYKFSDVECSCKMLFLRRNQAGKLINLMVEGAHFISVGSMVLLTNLDGFGRVSFCEESFSMMHSRINRSMTLLGLKDFPSWDALSELW